MTVRQMQQEISKLTGRTCESANANYLTQRLAALRKKKAGGGRMPNAPRVDRSAVVSVSLTRRRCELLARICKERKEGVSAVLRDAFDAWLRANGYRVEIDHIVRSEQAEG